MLRRLWWQKPESTITLPPGYELPAELIPTEPTVLSANEQTLMEADEIIGRNGMAPNPQTTGETKTVDLISLLPYKDREEVYDLFVDSVGLPFFVEAAEKLKEQDVNLRKLKGEARATGNRLPYNTFRENSNHELGITDWGVQNNLQNIYYEVYPQDILYSNYWTILEWYRLQLMYPDLPTFIDTPEPKSSAGAFSQFRGKGSHIRV